MNTLALHALRLFDNTCQYLPSLGPFQPPRGWFSAYEALNNGILKGATLYPSQQKGPEPEDSMTVLSGLNQAGFQPWPAFWTRADYALLLGRNALWRNPQGKFCLEAAYHLKPRRRTGEDKPLARCWVANPEILTGAWTSVVSNWGDGKNYFHWLFDNLTRLMMREQLPEQTRILIPNNPPRYILETLDLLELGHLATPVTGKPLRVERFYFCSPTAMTGVWNPAGFTWLREKFSKHRSEKTSGNPVFFTRRCATRTPTEIEQIESLFKQHGFNIVDCSKFSVAEQIRIASSAPAISGIHGAAMSNLIWAAKGTPVLEIFSPQYLNGCYEQISFSAGLAYQYLILKEEPLEKIKTWIKGITL